MLKIWARNIYFVSVGSPRFKTVKWQNESEIVHGKNWWKHLYKGHREKKWGFTTFVEETMKYRNLFKLQIFFNKDTMKIFVTSKYISFSWRFHKNYLFMPNNSSNRYTILSPPPFFEPTMFQNYRVQEKINLEKYKEYGTLKRKIEIISSRIFLLFFSCYVNSSILSINLKHTVCRSAV